jgi:hypothetical protein
MRDAPRVRI